MIQFSVTFSKWTKERITLKLKFSESDQLSRGLLNDALVIRTKKPEIFVSKETNQPLEEKKV